MQPMSDDELRVRVAELCGWSNCREMPADSGLCKWVGQPPEGQDAGWGSYSRLPDYPQDLNAMHEAEKLLFTDTWRRYIGFIIGKQWWDAWEFSDAVTLANASARQKAEAFVATMSPVTDQQEKDL